MRDGEGRARGGRTQLAGRQFTLTQTFHRRTSSRSRTVVAVSGGEGSSLSDFGTKRRISHVVVCSRVDVGLKNLSRQSRHLRL